MKRIAALTAMPLLAVGMYAAPAFAGLDDVGNTKVKNYNDATVENYLKVKADTGDNTAGGSYGGNGGNGGDVLNNGGDDIKNSWTGNGGNGGNADIGGTVLSGNATAWGKIKSVVNKNDTEINRCTCGGDKDEITGDDKVKNENHAHVNNSGKVKADTGDNDASGSTGGGAGDAGSLTNNGSGDIEDSGTGNGGNGGTGAPGGLVVTGHSDASGEIVNIVNKNITRILR